MRQIYQLSTPEDPTRPPLGQPGGPGPAPEPGDEAAFRIEVWNEAGDAVATLAAWTATASLGFVAYYAAAREYPDRVITLRRGAAVLATWGRARRG